MDRLEHNIKMSFSMVKRDMDHLKSKVEELMLRLDNLDRLASELKSKPNRRK
ncbi:MAG: hypothetical protein WC867_00710 [Candidatus Pacearchaeota archaeon]|jgi:hypothetical protein